MGLKTLTLRTVQLMASTSTVAMMLFSGELCQIATDSRAFMRQHNDGGCNCEGQRWEGDSSESWHCEQHFKQCYGCEQHLLRNLLDNARNNLLSEINASYNLRGTATGRIIGGEIHITYSDSNVIANVTIIHSYGDCCYNNESGIY